MTRLFLYAFIYPALISGCSTFKSRSDPQTPHFTGGTVIKTGPRHCREPSGIVFSARRGTLFVADDESTICELRLDGTLVNKKRINRADLEGITNDPATGLLYAIKEHAKTILELDPDSFELLRQFPVETTPGTHISTGKHSNQGIEAITFIPDPDHPAGGTFFIAGKGWRTSHAKSVAAVYEIDAPLHDTAAASRTAYMVRYFVPGISDLSGLHYDDRLQQLLLISDNHDTFMLLSTDGNIRAGYPLPGKNQEGITLDADGHLYIAEDSGDIIKYIFDATIKPYPPNNAPNHSFTHETRAQWAHWITAS
jgi:uncharacterized protein YjiK